MTVVAIVISAIVVSAIAGRISYNNSPPVVGPADDCAVCRKLESWWKTVSFWIRGVYMVWYLMQRAECYRLGLLGKRLGQGPPRHKRSA